MNYYNENNSITYEDCKFNSEQFGALNDMRQRQTLCDVILKVGDQTFPAHRVILASSSPYFYAMFTNNMAESNLKEITIKDIDPIIFKTLIDFAYSGKVNIKRTNVRELMLGAKYLQFNQVCDICATFLIWRIRPYNALGFRSFGILMDCSKLTHAADKYINQHFHQVAGEEEFLLLELDELLKIIRRDELNVWNEEIIFERCIKWIEFDKKSRQEFCYQVLSQVRLSCLTPQYLTSHVDSIEMIQSSQLCRDLIAETRKLQLNNMDDSNARKRNERQVEGQIFVVGKLLGDQRRENIFQIFDHHKGYWTEVAQMLEGRGVAMMDSKLYAFGICTGNKYIPKLEIYCMRKHYCIHRDIKMCARINPGVIAVNHKIYICGGYNGDPLNIFECYCPKSGILTTLSPMIKPRSKCVLAVIGSFIYAMGTNDEEVATRSLERFDMKNNIWTEMKEMLLERRDFGFAALNGCLFVCGGHDGNKTLASAEMYDPTTDSWRFIAPMRKKRRKFALTANSGKLWALGGCDNHNHITTIEVYDPDRDTWFTERSRNYSPVNHITAGVLEYNIQ